MRAIVLGAVTRPIVNFSYALDRAVWGAGPFGFHVTNVLLHMLNVVLLFQLAWRFENGPGARGLCGGDSARGAPDDDRSRRLHQRAVRGAVRDVLHARDDERAPLAAQADWRRHGGPGRCTRQASGSRRLPQKRARRCFRSSSSSTTGWAWPGSAAGRRRRLLTVHLPLIATAVVAGIVRLVILARIEYPGTGEPSTGATCCSNWMSCAATSG